MSALRAVQQVEMRSWRVQAVWVVIALPLLLLFCFSLISSFAYLRSSCIVQICAGGPDTPGLPLIRLFGITADVYAAYYVVLDGLFALLNVLIAALLVWRKPDDRVALLGAYALLFWGTATLPRSMSMLAVLHPALLLVVNIPAFLGLAGFTIFGYLFPFGYFTPRWACIFAFAPILAFLPSYIWPGSPIDITTWSLFWIGILILLPMGGLIGTQIYRYRCISDRLQRQQTKWVVSGLIATSLYFVAFSVLPFIFLPAFVVHAGALVDMLHYTGLRIAFMLIPITIGIAILRYRLWNIEPILSRTLLYGSLTAGVVGIYVLIVGYFSIGLRIGNNVFISLFATGIIAVVFQPMRERLQRMVNRLVYGQRDDPYSVVMALGQQLEHSLTPDAILPTLVKTVAASLKLPYAAISLHYGDTKRLVAEYGQRQEELTSFALTYQDETVGALLVAPRSTGETFAAADQRLLTVLARQTGMVAYSLRLTNELRQLTLDLQQSREHLVLAREEERRRLRRDLHDGVGPTLASLLQRIDAAQYLIRDDPDAAVGRLQELKSQVRTTIADIRRLVYALRPPAIDELGLLSAIREHVAQAAGHELAVHVEAVPNPLPSFPAAVEIAAYRIVLEAFTNVQRHAHARYCSIHLQVEETSQKPQFTICITDDGEGLPMNVHTGVGMNSMRERVAELGGRLSFEQGEHGGLSVRALLPTTLVSNEAQESVKP